MPKITKQKAKNILRKNEIGGSRLSASQRRYYGKLAKGQKPTNIRNRIRKT